MRKLGLTALGTISMVAAATLVACGEDFAETTPSTTTTGRTGGGGSTPTGQGGSGGGTASGTAGTGGTAGGAGGAAGSGTGGSGQGGFNPAEDPTAQINHPGDGECRVVNLAVPFVGVANDPQDGALTGSSLVWTCSIDGQIGVGATFNFTPTQVAQHVITLTATDSDTNTGIDQVTLSVQATCP